MKIFFAFITLTFFVSTLFFILIIRPTQKNNIFESPLNSWKIQSIDTVKYSRDAARAHKNDPNFDKFIDKSMAQIASTGATHVAIGTPYDEEFRPFLQKWISSARSHGLSVWFRGNWSGWEGWFDYPKINYKDHQNKTASFIKNNPSLFQDGDIFDSCPECENGTLGDPRSSGRIVEFRSHISELANICKTQMNSINKSVECNFHSLNPDVANVVMDKDTASKNGNIIVIDIYVSNPSELVDTVKKLHNLTGAQIVIGEFGAPIPGINGEMNQTEQDNWLSSVLSQISSIEYVKGVNYWANVGSSTALWNSDTPRIAVSTLNSYFRPTYHTLVVKNSLGFPLNDTVLSIENNQFIKKDNVFKINSNNKTNQITVSSPGFISESLVVNIKSKEITEIKMQQIDASLLYRVLALFF